MNNNSIKLYEFIEKNVLAEKINSYIKNHGLEKIMLPYIRTKIRESKSNDVVEKIKYQKMKYDLLFGETKKLNETFKKNNIPMILMKGFVIANEIYSPPELRTSDDIDILVPFSRLKDADKIMRSNGFITRNDDTYTNSLKCVLENQSVADELTHLNVYHKYGSLSNGEEYHIEVDLHIRPFHYLSFDVLNGIDSIFLTANKRVINNYEILTTNEVDTLIHLSAHFVRHYYWELFKFLRLGEPYFFRLDLLFEIYLYIEKYKDILLVEKTIKRAKDLNQIEPLALVIYYLVGLFNDLEYKAFYENIISLMHDNKFTNGISSRFIKTALSLDVKKQILLENFDLANYLLENLYFDIPPIYLVENEFTHIDMKTALFNCNQVEVDKKYYAHLMQYKIIENNIPDFKIIYNSEEIMISGSIIEAPNLEFNFFAISFTNFDNIHFFDEFSEEQNKMYYRNCFNCFIDNTLTIKHNGVNYENSENMRIKMEHSKGVFYSSIPWKCVGINPLIHERIGIQIAVEYKAAWNCEVKYVRYVSKNGMSIEYNTYFPWPTEYCNAVLIR